MVAPAKPSEPTRATTTLELTHDRALDIDTDGTHARIRVRSPIANEQIELELHFGPEGPVIRTRAAALELDAAQAITARCSSFAVHAEGDIDLNAGGELRCRSSETTIESSPGAVRLKANDDVQLLGELILLNCDRLPPMPDWVPPTRHQPSSLPPNAVLGDPEVVAALLGEPQAPPTDGTES
ncbi:hypothetical protein ACNOYE_31575 [Nannocystaceae bacterium ST9]